MFETTNSDDTLIRVVRGPKMIEDFIYEVVPVLGFSMCATSIFILLIMRRSKGPLKFLQFLAVTDLISGVGTVYAGFYGVIVTIYGNSSELVDGISCLQKAAHLIVFVFTDYLHLVSLVVFTADRFVQILFPVTYAKKSCIYLNWKFFMIYSILTLGGLVPAFKTPYENLGNSSARIVSQCRLDDVTGENFYTIHIFIIQWVPITCISTLGVIFLIYVIRQSRHKWSYNWSEEKSTTKQLFFTIFLRCFFSAISVHLPLLIIANSPENKEINTLSDQIIRISSSVLVTAMQPIWYLLVLVPFQNNVHTFFNKYSTNTKRNWQSASDPPQDDAEHYDRHGSPNPFGSWYSVTGNVTGEAGVPTGNERSVSFYYDNPAS